MARLNLALWRSAMNACLAKSLTVVAVTLSACAICPGAVGDAKEEVVKEELKKFEGTWALTSAERKGEKAPAEAIKDFRLAIKGNKLTIRVGGPPLEGTLTVDPSKKPRAYDTRIAVDDRKQTSVGIYELDERLRRHGQHRHDLRQHHAVLRARFRGAFSLA
jgi:uncharacterized protein (TIGR03067 family)